MYLYLKHVRFVLSAMDFFSFLFYSLLWFSGLKVSGVYACASACMHMHAHSMHTHTVGMRTHTLYMHTHTLAQKP